MKYCEEIKKLDEQYRQISRQRDRYSDVIFKYQRANDSLVWLDENFDEVKPDQKLLDRESELAAKLQTISERKKEIEKEVEKGLESHKRDFVLTTWIRVEYLDSEKNTRGHFFDFSFKYSTLVKNRWILEKKILPLIENNQTLFENLKNKAIELAKNNGIKNITGVGDLSLTVRLDRVNSAFTLDYWNNAIELQTIVPDVDQIIQETEYLANCGNIKWVK